MTVVEFLIESLERHSQVLQRNTAAVTSLLEELRGSDAAQPRVIREQLADQLEQAARLIERLEELRRVLASPPPPVAPGLAGLEATPFSIIGKPTAPAPPGAGVPLEDLLRGGDSERR